MGTTTKGINIKKCQVKIKPRVQRIYWAKLGGNVKGGGGSALMMHSIGDRDENPGTQKGSPEKKRIQ